MKIQTQATIDGNPVTELMKVSAEIKMYQVDKNHGSLLYTGDEENRAEIYFVNVTTGDVTAKMHINAGSGQGMGYFDFDIQRFPKEVMD